MTRLTLCCMCADSGVATSKRAELEQRGDVPTHRRLQDEEVLGNGAKRRKLEGRGAGGGSRKLTLFL